MNQIHIITADKEKEFSLHEKIASKFNEFIYVAKYTIHGKRSQRKTLMGGLDNTF